MKTFPSILGWLVTILIPFFLMITSIRVLTNTWYPEFEYRTPNFPVDTYGFKLEDRLQWSKKSIEYLLNGADISFLGDLKFQDGNPLFQKNELSHMVDVKNVIQGAFGAWWILFAVIVGAGVWTRRINWFSIYLQALGRGGWLTIALIGAILAGVAVSFRWLFTEFHRIFFTGESWLFSYSDTLIRLFPMQFWQDAFILMGIFTLSGAGLLIIVNKKLKRKYN